MYLRPAFMTLILLTTVSCATQSNNDELLNDVKDIKKELASLKSDIATIKAATAQDNTKKVSQGMPQEARRSDITKLKAITLPEKPTKDDVIAYFDKIDEASTFQNHYSSSDAQVNMICKAGQANIELVLDRAKFNNSISDIYYKAALKKMVTQQNKALIINELDNIPDLIDIISANHWEDDAKDTIIKTFKIRYNALPQSWISAVAYYHDPETYPLIKQAFLNSKYGQNEIYDTIKYIPEINISAEDIDLVWKRAKKDNYTVVTLGLLAASYGNRDALEKVFILLKNVKKTPDLGWLFEKLSGIYDVIDYSGPYPELITWYDANKDKLVYDKNTKKFVLKKQ